MTKTKDRVIGEVLSWAIRSELLDDQTHDCGDAAALDVIGDQDLSMLQRLPSLWLDGPPEETFGSFIRRVANQAQTEA